MERRVEDRHVVEFDAVAGVPQQQADAAHVAAPDKGDRKRQLVANDAGARQKEAEDREEKWEAVVRAAAPASRAKRFAPGDPMRVTGGRQRMVAPSGQSLAPTRPARRPFRRSNETGRHLEDSGARTSAGRSPRPAESRGTTPDRRAPARSRRAYRRSSDTCGPASVLQAEALLQRVRIRLILQSDCIALHLVQHLRCDHGNGEIDVPPENVGSEN